MVMGTSVGEARSSGAVFCFGSAGRGGGRRGMATCGGQAEDGITFPTGPYLPADQACEAEEQRTYKGWGDDDDKGWGDDDDLLWGRSGRLAQRPEDINSLISPPPPSPPPPPPPPPPAGTGS